MDVGRMTNNSRVGNTTVERQSTTVNANLSGVGTQQGVAYVVLQFKSLAFGIGTIECFKDRTETMEGLVVVSCTVLVEFSCVLCSDADGVENVDGSS